MNQKLMDKPIGARIVKCEMHTHRDLDKKWKKRCRRRCRPWLPALAMGVAIGLASWRWPVAGAMIVSIAAATLILGLIERWRQRRWVRKLREAMRQRQGDDEAV